MVGAKKKNCACLEDPSKNREELHQPKVWTQLKLPWVDEKGSATLGV